MEMEVLIGVEQCGRHMELLWGRRKRGINVLEDIVCVCAVLMLNDLRLVEIESSTVDRTFSRY